jgi:asparagine synthase (glutamine-hydrolysing)
MSIFAGIYARNRDAKLTPTVIAAIRASISRSKDDINQLIEYSDARLFMAKVDIGAYEETGVLSEGVRQAFVAGAPLLQDRSDHVLTRCEALKMIASDLFSKRTDALRACRGQYCAVVYESSEQVLHLVVDKLGVRPIYCWTSPDFVVFSTAMRIIENLEFCKKTIDIRGVAERAALGYSLSDRSAYENVKVLLAGECITFREGEMRRQRYWRWDELPPPNDGYPDVETRAYATFRDAVRIRFGNDKRTTAFLSGGLDSRSIAAMLRVLDADVLSINFAPPGSQDQVFAALAAHSLGTRHTETENVAVGEGDVYGMAALLPYIKSPEYEGAQIDRPRLIWSGDGGSVGLGHTYLNEEMVQLMRTGDIPGAVGTYLLHNRHGIDARPLKPAVGSTMIRAIQQGIEEELRLLHPTDAGRAIHLYLMLNDQRRHLADRHFEHIDLSRVDFHLPFFDAEFLTSILREPIDPFLRHNFYLSWLRKFPPGVLEVPWQAYPGHAPCPIPVPAGLAYQWDRNSKERDDEIRREALTHAQTIMRSKRFSDQYVHKPYLLAMRVFLQAGVRGKGYWINGIATLHRYWIKCDGNA